MLGENFTKLTKISRKRLPSNHKQRKTPKPIIGNFNYKAKR